MDSVATPPAIIVIDEAQTRVEEAPPHGAIGRSTAWRISDAVPAPRSMEFRKRMLHKDAAIGLHRIDHDEVYYVLEGEGEVSADGKTAQLRAGMTAWLHAGAEVGIRQIGGAPLTLIISYPLAPPKRD